MTAKSKRTFRGFAVLERPDGALIWGTFRPTKAEAEATFQKWNPQHTGAAHVVPVKITLEPKN